MAQDRARPLGKKALDEVEPGTVGRREGEGKAPRGMRHQPSRRLARDVRRMVVEDDLDRGVGRMGGVEELEELDEFPAAMPPSWTKGTPIGSQLSVRCPAVAFDVAPDNTGWNLSDCRT